MWLCVGCMMCAMCVCVYNTLARCLGLMRNIISVFRGQIYIHLTAVDKATTDYPHNSDLLKIHCKSSPKQLIPFPWHLFSLMNINVTKESLTHLNACVCVRGFSHTYTPQHEVKYLKHWFNLTNIQRTTQIHVEKKNETSGNTHKTRARRKSEWERIRGNLMEKYTHKYTH